MHRKLLKICDQAPDDWIFGWKLHIIVIYSVLCAMHESEHERVMLCCAISTRVSMAVSLLCKTFLRRQDVWIFISNSVAHSLCGSGFAFGCGLFLFSVWRFPPYSYLHDHGQKARAAPVVLTTTVSSHKPPTYSLSPPWKLRGLEAAKPRFRITILLLRRSTKKGCQEDPINNGHLQSCH